MVLGLFLNNISCSLSKNMKRISKLCLKYVLGLFHVTLWDISPSQKHFISTSRKRVPNLYTLAPRVEADDDKPRVWGSDLASCASDVRSFRERFGIYCRETLVNSPQGCRDWISFSNSRFLFNECYWMLRWGSFPLEHIHILWTWTQHLLNLCRYLRI